MGDTFNVIDVNNGVVAAKFLLDSSGAWPGDDGRDQDGAAPGDRVPARAAITIQTGEFA
jgi:hypothetical protein